MIKTGEDAPKFKIRDLKGRIISIKNLGGRWVIVFFYKQHFGKRCTETVRQFITLYKRFQELGAEILGITPDEEETGKLFIEYTNPPFSLISDPTQKILRKFKINYEKNEGEFTRSTILINPNGKIEKIWIYEKVNNHAATVLKELENKQKSRELKNNKRQRTKNTEKFKNKTQVK